jgi:hypothetical protein
MELARVLTGCFASNVNSAPIAPPTKFKASFQQLFEMEWSNISQLVITRESG